MQGLEAWALWALIVKAALAVIYVAMIIFPVSNRILRTIVKMHGGVLMVI